MSVKQVSPCYNMLQFPRAIIPPPVSLFFSHSKFVRRQKHFVMLLRNHKVVHPEHYAMLQS